MIAPLPLPLEAAGWFLLKGEFRRPLFGQSASPVFKGTVFSEERTILEKFQ
jgi:hypothetical protein